MPLPIKKLSNGTSPGPRSYSVYANPPTDRKRLRTQPKLSRGTGGQHDGGPSSGVSGRGASLPELSDEGLAGLGLGTLGDQPLLLGLIPNDVAPEKLARATFRIEDACPDPISARLSTASPPIFSARPEERRAPISFTKHSSTPTPFRGAFTGNFGCSFPDVVATSHDVRGNIGAYEPPGRAQSLTTSPLSGLGTRPLPGGVSPASIQPSRASKASR